MPHWSSDTPTPVSALDRGAHLALHRMAGRHIAVMIDAARAGDADKARMLAGAIVVQRGRRIAGARQRLARGLVRGPVRAAFERRARRARRAPACGSRPRHAPARRRGWRTQARVPRRRSRSGRPRRSRSAAAPAAASRPSADNTGAATSPSASTRRAVRIHDRDRAAVAALDQARRAKPRPAQDYAFVMLSGSFRSALATVQAETTLYSTVMTIASSLPAAPRRSRRKTLVLDLLGVVPAAGRRRAPARSPIEGGPTPLARWDRTGRAPAACRPRPRIRRRACW